MLSSSGSRKSDRTGERYSAGASGGVGNNSTHHQHHRRHSHSYNRRLSTAANFRVADDSTEPNVMKLFKRETSETYMNLESISTVTIYEGSIPHEYLKERVGQIMQLNPWLDGRLVKRKHTIVLRYYTPVTDTSKSLKIIRQTEVQRRHSSKIDLVSSPDRTETGSIGSVGLQQYEQFQVKTGRECVAKDDEPVFKVTAIAQTPDQFVLIMSMSHVIADGHTFYNIYKMLSSSATPRALIAEREMRFNDQIARYCQDDEKFIYSAGTMANFACRMFGRSAPMNSRFVSPEWVSAQKRAFSNGQISSQQHVPRSVAPMHESNKVHCFDSSKKMPKSEFPSKDVRPLATELAMTGTSSSTPPSTGDINSINHSSDSKEDNSVRVEMQPKPSLSIQPHEEGDYSTRRRKSNGKSDDDRGATPTADFISTNDLVTSKFFCVSDADVGFMAINFRKRISGLTDEYAGNYEGTIAYQRGDYENPLLIRKSLTSFHRANSTGPLYPGFFARWRANISTISNWTTFYDDVELDGCKQLMHMPFFRAQRVPMNMAVVYMQSKERPVVMTMETNSPAIQLMLREGVLVEDISDLGK